MFYVTLTCPRWPWPLILNLITLLALAYHRTYKNTLFYYSVLFWSLLVANILKQRPFLIYANEGEIMQIEIVSLSQNSLFYPSYLCAKFHVATIICSVGWFRECTIEPCKKKTGFRKKIPHRGKKIQIFKANQG